MPDASTRKGGYAGWVVEIRIAHKGSQHPRRAWVHSGLQCCTYVGHAGSLCGYVRIPTDGLHLVSNDQWTYGPDAEGWVGFHTSAPWDFWDPHERLQLAAATGDVERIRQASQLVAIGAVSHQLPDDTPWTEQLVEAAVEAFAACYAQSIEALP